MTMTDNGLRIESFVKNCDRKTSMDDLFTKEGIIGMLEASEINIIDKLSPFHGVSMARASYESNTCPISTMFTHYVHRTRQLCGITKCEK